MKSKIYIRKRSVYEKNSKTMKTGLLFFAVTILLKITGAFAQYGGETGPLTWNLNKNTGTLTISGVGEMPDYNVYYAPWYVASDYFNTVIIDTGVLSIGNRAFYGCDKFTSIIIPNSITRIGNEAFSYCMALASIEIPNGVKTIGSKAFHAATQLKTITIPGSLTSIGEFAFMYCNKLIAIDVEKENSMYASENGVLFNKDKTSLICCPAAKTNNYIVPAGVTSIENYAFFSCVNLTSVAIPSTTKSIGAFAFSKCTSLASITTPDYLKSIEDEAFSFCEALTAITIPNGVERIASSCFMKCTALTSVIIPNGVTSVEKSAFDGCKELVVITIPETVTTLGVRAFAACYNLSLITNLNPNPIAISPCVFSAHDLCLLPPMSHITLKVPNSAVALYQNANVWNRFDILGGGILVNPLPNHIEYGYTTGNGLYETDIVATVEAVTNLGCKFINWTVDDVEVSTNNLYSFTVTENIKLVANFENHAGMVEVRDATSLQLYPNPTTGELRIRNEDLEIRNVEIFDVFGRKLSSHHLISSSSHYLINISHLNSGLYFLKITTGKGMVVKKVIKQ